MNRSDVRMDQNEVSIGLIHLLFRRFFLHTFTLKLTPTKNVPRRPPTTPMMMDPRIFWYELTRLDWVMEPNLTVEPEKPSLTF